MTTISEKTADYATLLDDIASALTATSAWSDADTNVTNSGDSDDWTDNARVLENVNTGTFLTLSIGFGSYNNSNFNAGLHVCHSTDFDSSIPAPAGKTDLPNRSDGNRTPAYMSDVGNWADESFDNVSEHDGRHSPVITAHRADPGNISPTQMRTKSVTYFGAVNGSSFRIAVWNTTNGTEGIASYYAFEYVDNKFWSDSEVPVAIVQADTNNAHCTEYGFRDAFREETDLPLAAHGGAIGDGRWGKINPSSTDDTFFFTRPIVFSSSSRSYPVAYMTDLVPNDDSEGAAHGDEITHDSDTYRILSQSGESVGNVATVGLKYQ